MTKRHGALAVVVVILLTMAALAATSCGDSGGAGGTLSVFVAEPAFIDPLLTCESEGLMVDHALFESLTQYDYITTELEPCVAESWQVNDDATVFTFHLRKGTKFHNGREVVAGDFKYQWERLSNPKNESVYVSHLSMVDGFDEMQSGGTTELSGVRVVDDYTLEVTMASSFPEFPHVVSFSDTAPVPREEVEKDPEAFSLMPIGNGPFKMAEPWAPGQYIKVVRYEEYSGAKPKIDGIDFRIYSEVGAAFMDFKAGTLDWVMIPTGQYETTVAEYGASDDGITANPGKQVQNAQEYGIVQIILNNQDELFKNADLRRAVSLAINRQAICDVAWEGVRKPASSIIPVGFPGYEENAWQYSRFDREAAKTMLAKAGYPNGEGLPALGICFVSGVGLETYMQLVQADLKAVGITVELEGSDGQGYYEKVITGEYQIGASGWSCDYPTIDAFIRPLFFSTGSVNLDLYNSAAVDEAMLAAGRIIDDSERMKAAQAVVRMIGDDCPEIAVATYAHSRVASDRVHNLVYSQMNQLDFVSCWISE